MKRQVSDWQKIFANLISDKGHVLRIYKEHTIRNGQKIWIEEAIIHQRGQFSSLNSYNGP